MAKCSQEKCRISEGGACLEGHQDNCPYLLPDTESDDPLEVDEHSVVQEEPIRFHSGEKLNVSEASQLLADRAARMVLCAGTQFAGKTTFLARIGEMFRNGTFQRFKFSGSTTLCAFERATWLATIPSGGGRPDTLRTHRREADTFLHLKVYEAADPSTHSDLLISDFPGEMFPSAVASQDLCAQQRALSRADHLALFLDSKCLVDSRKRHSERDNALGFLRQVTCVRHNTTALFLQIVFSRWDSVALHSQCNEHESYCESLASDILQRFGDSFAAVTFWHIAARPDGMDQTNDQIQALFGYWLETTVPNRMAKETRVIRPARDFCAFGLS
jgi:hypothetical protein